MTEPTAMVPPHGSAGAALTHALQHVARLNAERRGDPALERRLTHLARWQARRMGNTYADLAADARYADAIAFFQSDIYGPADFTRRDADLARAAPLLARTLPNRVLASLAEAMELNALSQELDRRLVSLLPADATRFSVAQYCAAYRAMGANADRDRQLRLIESFGSALDGYVKNPLVQAALAMMRHPARVAGFSSLQGFLERGFGAFRKMHGAGIFIATIDRRERALIAAILAGDDAPFPEPLAPDSGA